MNLSAPFWSVLWRAHSAGLGQCAAFTANRAYRDRHFVIDADGHWITQQAEATFASPDLHPLRYDYLAEVVTDTWLYVYSPQPTDVVFDIGAGSGKKRRSSLALSSTSMPSRRTGHAPLPTKDGGALRLGERHPDSLRPR